ncbi:MAG: exodeoxyribonuclease V subunit gamma, partial [Bacteroidaceae bacterium]|nr:exodeoxyribonuclease V subunit gamma [Bacteroidaceae bacterium]
MKDKYITGEELLDVLCFAVPKSNILKGSTIVLDGFTGFTPVQNRLLKELLMTAERVIVTATMNEEKRSESLFALGHEMVDTLTKIAKECKVEIEDPICLYQKPVYRFREKTSLAFLEENAFRYTGRTFASEADGISIYHAKNPKEEINFVAQKIRRLVRTEGLHYREIAVITSDMESYSSSVENIFAKYNIPYFMDHKRSILLNSFVEFIRSLIDMAEQNFTYESVFRYLRTDLSNLNLEEVDLLENYCLALGIRGQKKWQETWIRRAKGMEEADLAVINSIRVKFMSEIEQIMSVIKKRSKTVEEVTIALYNFLVDKELQQKVKAYEDMFEKQGELALEKEYA